MIEKIKQDIFWQIMIASLFALATAYSGEIILGLKPCILCIYQRIPYFLILFIALFAIKFPFSKKIAYFIIIGLFISETSLAFYHVGVEHYIFEESYTCQDKHQAGSLLTTIELASNCSQVAFKFMNFSMAEWNLIYSFGFLCFFIYKERKNGPFTWRSK